MRGWRGWLLALLGAALPCAAATVTTADGRALQDDNLALKAGQLTVHAAGAGVIPVSEVLSIEFGRAAGEDLMARAGQQVLILEDGSAIALGAASAIADGKLTTATAFTGPLTISLERAARLLRPRPHERPADLEQKIQTLRIARENRDWVVLSKTQAQWVPVPGILLGLGADGFRINYDGTETVFDSPSVPIVLFAKLSKGEPRILGELAARDGSRLAFESIEIAGKQITLASAALGKVTVPTDQAAVIRFRNERLLYLSDLEPVEARQTGFFNEQFAYRKDRAADGGPLRLDGVTYTKGLGLHTRCELVYDLDGGFKVLTALAGMDDGTPLGAAVLNVLADGKPLVKGLALKRGQPVERIRAELAGVKRLTIAVDFGERGFGAGERVSLGEATLVR